jgi:hypothetical protein
MRLKVLFYLYGRPLYRQVDDTPRSRESSLFEFARSASNGISFSVIYVIFFPYPRRPARGNGIPRIRASLYNRRDLQCLALPQSRRAAF